MQVTNVAISESSTVGNVGTKDIPNKLIPSAELTTSPTPKSNSTSPLPKAKSGNNNKSKQNNQKNHNSRKKGNNSIKDANKANRVNNTNNNKSKEVLIETKVEMSSTSTKSNKDKVKRSGSRSKRRNKDKDKESKNGSKDNNNNSNNKDSVSLPSVEEELSHSLDKVKLRSPTLSSHSNKTRERKATNEDTSSQYSNSLIHSYSESHKSNSPKESNTTNGYNNHDNNQNNCNPNLNYPLQFIPNVYPLFMPAQMQDGRFVFVPVTYPMLNNMSTNNNNIHNGNYNYNPHNHNTDDNDSNNDSENSLNYNNYNTFINPIYIPNHSETYNIHNNQPYYDINHYHLLQDERNYHLSSHTPIFTPHVGVGFPNYNNTLPIVNNKGEIIGYKNASLNNKHYLTNNQDIISSHFDPNNSQNEISPEYLDDYNHEIDQICEELKPKEYEKERQDYLLALLRGYLQEVFPDAELHPFGSTANGLGLVNADMDLCVCFTKEVERKVTAVEFVERFGARLLQDGSFIEVKLLTRTRIPIIKLKHSNGLASDIGFENKLALWNTRLLKTYSEIDPRLKKLVYLIKHWSKQRNINEPYFGTLSSYCYVLMTIFYLQQKSSPALPCLQKISKTKEIPIINVDGHNVYFFEDIKNLDKYWKSENKETIIELLFGFFQYYAYAFQWSRSVVSVRTGHILSKEEKGWIKAKYSASPSTGASVADRFWLCVEDPFELNHNLGRPADRNSVYEIRGEFIRATKNLKLREPTQVLSKLFQTYLPNQEPSIGGSHYPNNPYAPRVNPIISRRSL